MKLFPLRLKQRDGVTCGPSAAVVAGALLDPVYGAPLTGDAVQAWFAGEQSRIHQQVNRIWPRRLGATPVGMARALSVHSRPRGVAYRWRIFRGRRDRLTDVREAVAAEWPVAMLVGKIIPRHWVLIVGVAGERFRCYEPSSGEVRPTAVDAIRESRVSGLGFPRPFAFVLPDLTRSASASRRPASPPVDR